MVRHLRYNPEPMPIFWKSEIALGKCTELEYYKYIYPRTLIKVFLVDLDSNMWIKDIKKKWEEKLK